MMLGVAKTTLFTAIALLGSTAPRAPPPWGASLQARLACPIGDCATMTEQAGQFWRDTTVDESAPVQLAQFGFGLPDLSGGLGGLLFPGGPGTPFFGEFPLPGFSKLPDPPGLKCAYPFLLCIPDKDLPGQMSQAVIEALSGAERAILEVTKLVQDGLGLVVTAHRDALAALATSDAVAEAQRFGREIGTAGKALVEATGETFTGNFAAVSEAAKRAREGKFVDAIWHLALAPVTVAEQSAGNAVLTSEYLRALGQVAATTYGGPQGAAAYAAWLTYRQTGNAELALRMGIISGASAAAFSAMQTPIATNGSPGITAEAALTTARRAIVVGAIGGLAVAGAGGNKEAVEKAFLQAGAMVVVRDGYQYYTGHSLSAEPARQDAYCISDASTGCTQLPPGAKVGTDANGNYIVDMTKVDPSVSAVGLKDHSALFNEQSPEMSFLSRVPGMQAMALFHDHWAAQWDMNALTTMSSIAPAIVITYTGFGVQFYETLQQTAVEKALSGTQGGSSASHGLAPVQREMVTAAYTRLADGEVADAIVLQQMSASRPLFCHDADQTWVNRKIGPVREPRCVSGPALAMPPSPQISSAPHASTTTSPFLTCPSGQHVSWQEGRIITMRMCLNFRLMAEGKDGNVVARTNDYACLLTTFKSGKWQIVAASLEERGGCDAALSELKNSLLRPDEGWLVGEPAAVR